jgi:TFIIF-interacting CTD phosphatase-like protein
MAQYYEIISFTCAYPNQIDKVIDILDARKSIKHRLYRHHAVPVINILFRKIIVYIKILKGLEET